jgi:hypothetical protein
VVTNTLPVAWGKSGKGVAVPDFLDFLGTVARSGSATEPLSDVSLIAIHLDGDPTILALLKVSLVSHRLRFWFALENEQKKAIRCFGIGTLKRI